MFAVAFAFMLAVFAVFFALIIILILRGGINGLARVNGGCINLLVPSGLHEINRHAAGIIFVAMLAPFFCVAGRHVHVDGLGRDGNGLDDDRLRINDLRLREVADVDAAKYARLGDDDGYAYLRES